MKVRRLGYALGAEITGVDLREDLDEGVVAEIRKVQLANVVLCIRGHGLNAQQMQAFCSRFGELKEHVNPHERHPDHPTLTMLANKPVNVNGKAYAASIADEWHTDQAYSVAPPSMAFLHAQELPEIGGDTLFANMYVAYETLSAAFLRMVESLDGVFDVAATAYFLRQTPERQAEVRERNPPVVHPLVRTHPETGRKSLYISSQLRNFRGMTAEESAPIRDYLRSHATRYEATYRHRWEPNDLVIWDNRCAMHRTVTDYDRSQIRRMIRCELRAPASGHLLAESEPIPA